VNPDRVDLDELEMHRGSDKLFEDMQRSCHVPPPVTLLGLMDTMRPQMAQEYAERLEQKKDERAELQRLNGEFVDDLIRRSPFYVPPEDKWQPPPPPGWDFVPKQSTSGQPPSANGAAPAKSGALPPSPNGAESASNGAKPPIPNGAKTASKGTGRPSPNGHRPTTNGIKAQHNRLSRPSPNGAKEHGKKKHRHQTAKNGAHHHQTGRRRFVV
jgi:hypothetical protein